MKLRKLIYLLPVLMVPMISVPILMTSCSDKNTKQENNNTQGDSNNSNSGDSSTSGGNNNGGNNNGGNNNGGNNNGGNNNGGNSNTGGGSNSGGGSTGNNSGTTNNPIYEKYKQWNLKDVKLVYRDDYNNYVLESGKLGIYPDKDFVVVVPNNGLPPMSITLVRIVRIGNIDDDNIDPTNLEKYQGFKGQKVTVTFNDNTNQETGILFDLNNDHIFLVEGDDIDGEVPSYSFSKIAKIELTKTN